MPAFEPAVVAFAAGPDVSFAALRATLAPDELVDLTSYLAGQPSAAALRALLPAEFDRLVQRRLWALVHYLRSLKSPS
jgi:hypothetical protein